MANNYVSQNKLRRLGTRAVRVLERHREAYPFLGAFSTTLPPRVDTFVSLHDRLAIVATEKNRERQQGVGATLALGDRIKGWLAALRRDVPGFDATAFNVDSEVPDDIISAAGRLVETIRSYLDGSGQPLPYAAELESDLTAAIDAAEKEWAEAQDSLSTLQALQAEARKAGAALNRELIAFRQALRAALGRSHRDYQKLRVARTNGPETDDDIPVDPEELTNEPDDELSDNDDAASDSAASAAAKGGSTVEV